MKKNEIFSKEELEYLSKKRPDLIPLDIPSIDEANLLTQPTLDQIIVQFLQNYEVNVVPRSVGAWNGWDTLSGISGFFSSEKGSMSDIADTIFYANRSNQINSAAQEWGTWKRWVFDTKEREFEEFKNEVISSINIHNYNATKEIEKKIEEAESQNKKIKDALKLKDAKDYIAEAKKINAIKKEKQEKALGCSILLIPLVIIFFFAVDDINGGPEKRRKERENRLISTVRVLERKVEERTKSNSRSLVFHSSNRKDFPSKYVFNYFKDDLYKENREILIYILKLVIRDASNAGNIYKCYEENSGSRYYSLWMTRSFNNPNASLRKQVYADNNFWQKKAAYLCKEELKRSR